MYPLFVLDVTTGCAKWDASGEAEGVEELRGRIEILMDEIEIMLGLEPPGIIPPEDYDTGT